MAAAKQPRLRLTVPAPKPIGGLLDPRFVYIPAAATNVRATFERIRAEQGLQLKGKP